MRRALDKSELASMAARHGIDPPLTVACADATSALATAHELGFPVLVKPMSPISDTVTPPQRFSTFLGR